MSLETQIATLTEKMDALIGAIAANTHVLNHPALVVSPAAPAAAPSSIATTAVPSLAPADEKSEPKRRGRPSRKQVKALPAPVVEELPHQDGLFDPDTDAEPEGFLFEDVRSALFKLRDLAMTKLGKEVGLEHTRKVMSKYANHVEKINPKDYAALWRDCMEASAKL